MLSQNGPSVGPWIHAMMWTLLGHEWGCLHTDVLGTSGSTLSPRLRSGSRAGVRDSAWNLPPPSDIPWPLGGVAL